MRAQSPLFSSTVSAEDAQLLSCAAAWRERDYDSDIANLTPARLAEIARDHGLEFATAVFFGAATSAPGNAAFLAAVRAAEVAAIQRPDLIAIVPGAFHRENRDTGADGAGVIEIARHLNCPTEVIPIPGFGRIEANARAICGWLESKGDRRIALVSLSKGGADLKRALARPEASQAFSRVNTWVSFSGIVQGTPLIEWLRTRPLRWWAVRLLLWLRRHDSGTLHDLRHGPRALLEPWPALPSHLRIVHVCGVPLQRHLRHRWAPRGYSRLASLGPNDGGGILLGDFATAPGVVCPIWGADHYLQPSWDATPLLRDIVVAALTPAAPLHTIPSAKAPINAPATRSTA